MRIAVLLIAAALAGCATAIPVEGGGNVGVARDVSAGRARVEAFFKARFPATVAIHVAPDRASFDKALPALWGLSPTQCWMVGVGVANDLYLLSPDAWRRDACDHAGDAQEVQAIITHELTHAFHGQHNPTRDFTGMDDEGWFVEGLAVLVSGQLDSAHGGDARAAIAVGAAPASLASAWSGRYRYGVSGSMVRFIDETWGRATVMTLLSATTNADILARLHLSEADFLQRWREWALAH